jgi:hypothetical protein
MYYKNPNPSIIRSSMHVCMLIFLPAVTFLLHAFLPKITFLSDSACFQQAPNTDMWLVPSHLTLVCFVDLSCNRLELLRELCCLRLGLHSLLLECVQYLHCNLVPDHPCTLCLGLCHIRFDFLCLCNDLCCSLLEQFHLSLELLFCVCATMSFAYSFFISCAPLTHSMIDIVFCLCLRSWIVALILSPSWSHYWTC